MPRRRNALFDMASAALSMSSTPKQILHDRVNLVRLVRRLEKSVNVSDWGSEKSTLLWLRSEGLLQVRPFFHAASVAIY